MKVSFILPELVFNGLREFLNLTSTEYSKIQINEFPLHEWSVDIQYERGGEHVVVFIFPDQMDDKFNKGDYCLVLELFMGAFDFLKKLGNFEISILQKEGKWVVLTCKLEVRDEVKFTRILGELDGDTKKILQ